jgi:hypothetical protein
VELEERPIDCQETIDDLRLHRAPQRFLLTGEPHRFRAQSAIASSDVDAVRRAAGRDDEPYY